YALRRTWWANLRRQVERRAALALGPLARLEIVPVADGAVVAAEALPDAVNPLPSDHDDEIERVDRTLAALLILAAAIRPLHHAGPVWLTFAPDALEAAGDRLLIPTLDLEVFHAGTTPAAVRISPAYSPPEVCSFLGDKIGPATDVYHLGLYAYYRLA